MPSLAPAYPSEALETRNLPVLEPEVDPRSSSVQCTEVAYYVPGAVIEDKYELIRVLGEGGMGAVWVVRHRTLDVHLALKLVRTDRSEAIPGAGERMLNEARAAASLQHPAIVQVFDFGFTRHGHPFITMELLHGESLGKALDGRGRIAPTRAAQLLLPIADALGVAHDKGVVHRDVKPENVFLTHLADGRLQPKVLDFGIAKLGPELGPKLTVEGTVLGSPAYMSPEQARGEMDIDRRTDVWSLAVVLYELVTGQLPFQGDSYNARLWAILGEQPRSILELGVNEPELWALLLQGLAKDRNARFADMHEFGSALARWLDARGIKSDITKASLAPWLVHSGQPGVSLYPSLSPSAPVVPPVLAEAPPTIVIQGATPAVVADSSEAARVLVVGSKPKRQPARAATTAQRRFERPVSRRWHWFAGAAAASFIGAAVASLLGSREVATAHPRLTAPVVEAARVEPKPAPVIAEAPVAAPATSEPAAAPARKARSAPRTPRARPAARPPRVDELKNPFR